MTTKGGGAPAATPKSPRTQERIAASCRVETAVGVLCPWNARPDKTYYFGKHALRRARAEAAMHALAAGHIGTETVTVVIERKTQTSYRVIE